MEFKDYYKIMGVARDASQDEIRRVYRRLARKYHPDVSKAPDAEIRFKELGEAYAVLLDLEKRAAYDQLGGDWKAGQDFRPPPDWDAGFEFSGAGASGNDPDQFSDFFSALYGQSYAGARPGRGASNSRGADHHAKVAIELEDAYLGATRTITLQRAELDATGRVGTRARQLRVTIPRGVHAGQHIRLIGQGAAGAGKGKAGDLYLEVDFNPHALFRVEQRDVYLDVAVAPWEAALGATVRVPTPNGRIELKIPAGSVAGSKLRLKGRGIPGDTPGDFYAALNIALPPADSEAASAFYHYMTEQFKSFNPRAGLGV
jgi:curved DNA-binding protein